MRDRRAEDRGTGRILVAAAVLALALSPVALAQDWRGTGRAHGTVEDSAGEPLRNARVRLERGGGSASGPPEVKTDKRGRWSVPRIAPGRWRLTIAADGFITSEGWVDVRGDAPGPPTHVMLRPLDEGTPLFSEGGSGSTLLRWIEKGNSLLEQGRHAEARVEYERALTQLPPAEQPEVLRAVARTYFLEGDLAGAERELKRALVRAPDDSISRQLLKGVLEGDDRGDEADRWLSVLDTEGPEVAAPELMPRTAERPAAAAPRDDRPVLAAEAHRGGRFKTTFAAKSPLSQLDEFVARYEVSEADAAVLDRSLYSYTLAEESFEVAVPEGYSAERPHGLFVWVSPTPFGGFRNEEIGRVLSEHGLIWVGANLSGNNRSSFVRLSLALDAAHAMKELYNIDPGRVYVGGYSGGGRVSSALAMLFPEIFHGGFFFYGVDFFEPLPVPDKPGASWPASFPAPKKAVLKTLKNERQFVLLTGDQDFNRPQTLATYRAMKRRGFERATYLEIPGADHYHGIDYEWMKRGVTALEGSSR